MPRLQNEKAHTKMDFQKQTDVYNWPQILRLLPDEFSGLQHLLQKMNTDHFRYFVRPKQYSNIGSVSLMVRGE